jgi:hypothetical protein
MIRHRHAIALDARRFIPLCHHGRVRQARQQLLLDLRDRALSRADRRGDHLCLIRLRGHPAHALPRDHLIRGGIGVISLWMWFYSFSLLPIATAAELHVLDLDPR